VEFGEPGGWQRREGVSVMRTSDKGGVRAAVRGTECGRWGKKGDGARWLLCARTEGENGGEGARARHTAKREGRGPVWHSRVRESSGQQDARLAERMVRSGKKGNGPGPGRIVPSSIYSNISKKN
jgi:hypothetical protein